MFERTLVALKPSLLLTSLAFSALPGALLAQTAPTPVGLEVSGYGFTRFERTSGYGATAPAVNKDWVRYRFNLGLTTTPITLKDDLSLTFKLTPQMGGFWNVGGDSTEDPALGLHEGIMKLKGGKWSLEAGRFEMAYGDELVIGPVGWNHIGRSFDGARFRHMLPSDAWVDVFATQLDEGTVTGVTGDELAAGDRYFLGVYAGLGNLIAKGMDLDVYLFDLRYPTYSVTVADVTATQNGGDELTLGLRAKGRVSLFDYRFEAGYQLGSTAVLGVDTNPLGRAGMQADVEIGANIDALKGIRVGLEGFYASGDNTDTADVNEAWNPLFPTAHKWLGLMDYVDSKGGRSNIMGGAFHLKVGILEPLSLVLDAHSFSRPVALPDEGTDRPRGGMELDTGLIYKVGKQVSFRCAYDIFMKVEEDKASADEAPLRFVELEMLTRF